MATLAYRDILQKQTQNANQHIQKTVSSSHRITELATLLGMILQLHWGSFFRLRWENFNSTGDILYSSGEYSYTPLGNIKIVGDIMPSQR